MNRKFLALGLLVTFSISSFARQYDDKKIANFEQTVKENFEIITPSRWMPGDKFHYTEKELNILLKRVNPILKDTVDYTNRIFEFTGVRSNTDWFGNETVDLLFNVDGTQYMYETGKTLEQLADKQYNPLIPGLICERELSHAREFLSGTELYIVNNEWYNMDCSPALNSRKFVKVMITDFEPGDNDMPVKVFFRPVDEDNTYYIKGVLSGTLNATRRNQLFKLFTNKNPQDRYKNISQVNWNAIIKSQPVIGMTQEEVRLCIGSPSEVKRIPTYSGLRLMWYYNAGAMIYFEDGLVKEIKK